MPKNTLLRENTIHKKFFKCTDWLSNIHLWVHLQGDFTWTWKTCASCRVNRLGMVVLQKSSPLPTFLIKWATCITYRNKCKYIWPETQPWYEEYILISPNDPWIVWIKSQDQTISSVFLTSPFLFYVWIQSFSTTPTYVWFLMSPSALMNRCSHTAS